MQLIQAIIIVSFLMVLIPGYAMAYVGPGLGAGTIGLILGILCSVVIALFAVLWYPFKRILKKIKILKSEK